MYNDLTWKLLVFVTVKERLSLMRGGHNWRFKRNFSKINFSHTMLKVQRIFFSLQILSVTKLQNYHCLACTLHVQFFIS